MQLKLNRLSCDLPPSVLDWQAFSKNISFNLLDGNLFGCGTSNDIGTMALSIQGAAGLRSANEQAFEAYSCGNSDYVLPVITISLLAVPATVWLLVRHCRRKLALDWRITLERVVNPSTLINELDQADRQLKALALGVMAAATVAGSAALVLSLHVAKSAFECEYMAAPTLANKRDNNGSTLSIGIGAAGCVGLVLGLAPWWQRIAMKYTSSVNDRGGTNVKNMPLYMLEEDAEAWDFDAERVAEATPQRPVASYVERTARGVKLVTLLLALVLLTIGPNVGYVLVVLSDLSQQRKVASEMAVTLAKTAIGSLLVPQVARKAVNLLVLNGALTFVRFRLRMAIATALCVTTMIGLPVAIVLVTDRRCFYYAFNPQPAINTEVSYSICAVEDLLLGCLEYSTATATSTFTPRFAYDGEKCVSAVLSVYGSVFLGVVLLTATLQAGMETLAVPWLAPWCYRNSEVSTVARTGLALFREMTWNVWPTLADAGALAPEFSFCATKLDYLAQRVVERAFVQVMVTLLVALAFGIAVPAVGGACAVAAFVQLLHHRHVFGQIALLGRLEQPAIVPNLVGSTDIPFGCAVIVVATVVLVWVCGAVDFLKPVVIGCFLLIGPIVALVACCSAACRRSSRNHASLLQYRAPSTVSSDTSQGMLLESLIVKEEDKISKGEIEQ